MQAGSELILGGQKSGKSRRAELLAAAWLAKNAAHRAVLIATAQPWGDEMQARIARHKSDRAARAPSLITVEEPLELAATLRLHSQAHTMVLIDCLTLWLTNCLMPLRDEPLPQAQRQAHVDDLLDAIANSSGPVVLVGNEIGLGVIPLGAQVRAFVDELGVLNQRVAAACTRVTFMAAGLPLVLKDEA